MHRRIGVVRAAVFSLVVIVLVVSGLSAQQQGSGTITGKVFDASQGVLQGARIDMQPGGQSALTNANGEFTISDVSPGRYTVTASHEGFGVYTADVIVQTGSSVRVDATLQVARITRS